MQPQILTDLVAICGNAFEMMSQGSTEERDLGEDWDGFSVIETGRSTLDTMIELYGVGPVTDAIDIYYEQYGGVEEEEEEEEDPEGWDDDPENIPLPSASLPGIVDVGSLPRAQFPTIPVTFADDGTLQGAPLIGGGRLTSTNDEG